jgi:hypothetical protein
MRVVVVYESIFGNTREIAERIGVGLRPAGEVDVLHVAEASHPIVAEARLLVVGAPTHAHGLASDHSRAQAHTTAVKDGLRLEPRADGPGVREWLESLGDGDGGLGAAFDTRVHWPAALSGQASHVIGRRLRRRDFVLLTAPESFLVDMHNRLLVGEADRAQSWGARLAAMLTSHASPV